MEYDEEPMQPCSGRADAASTSDVVMGSPRWNHIAPLDLLAEAQMCASPLPSHPAYSPEFADEMLVSPVPSSIPQAAEDLVTSGNRKRGCCDTLGDSDAPSLDAPISVVDAATAGSNRVKNSACCSDYLVEDALREAFMRTDEEFASDASSDCMGVGSTAVAAVVGRRRVWVANCGDSRAVLCRAGRAVQLTDDHKPDREDEAVSQRQDGASYRRWSASTLDDDMAYAHGNPIRSPIRVTLLNHAFARSSPSPSPQERIRQAGGMILNWNGPRVMGVLAMTRAIGDRALRPFVIPDPEVRPWLG